jgi:gamma-glutamyltranspeptidase
MKFQTLKKPIQVEKKYQVGDYSGIHFSRNVQKKCKRGRDEFYKGEIAKTISGLLRNKAVFLAMKILRITTLNG